MVLTVLLADLKQLEFEIEEAAKAVPPLDSIFFEFKKHPIPMEITIPAAKKLAKLLGEQLIVESSCTVRLDTDKMYTIQNVSRS